MSWLPSHDLPVTFGKLSSLALGLLGFAVRWVASYYVLVPLYFVGAGISYWPFSALSRIPMEELFPTLFLTGLFYSKPPQGMTYPEFLQLLRFSCAGVAFVIAIVWGMVCRRRCRWFFRWLE